MIKMTRDMRPQPRMMGGDKSTWAPRPKMSLKPFTPKPVAMEHKVMKRSVSPSPPRMMGGDKSTWAPRPKMELRRIASPEPVKMENRTMKRSISPRPMVAHEPRPERILEKRTIKTSMPRMVGGDKSTWGLTNSKAAIHEDIRRMARKMDHEPPTMEIMKKEMKITTLPTVEEADKESEVVLKKMI
jgi:hypothetical protein